MGNISRSEVSEEEDDVSFSNGYDGKLIGHTKVAIGLPNRILSFLSTRSK